ncbi:MAG: hypothetical protein QG552_1762, partial [Thermodesulfobacteriota bacterium]|nr:hypothetical protein [Thermodesulfobacteriota bacterium]
MRLVLAETYFLTSVPLPGMAFVNLTKFCVKLPITKGRSPCPLVMASVGQLGMGLRDGAAAGHEERISSGRVLL